MTPQQVEFALKKQRLQLRSAELRGQLVGHVAGLAPALAVGDRVRAGLRWVRHNPEAVAFATVALAVARPRTLWRWMRHGVVAWRTFSRLREWTNAGAARI